MSGQDKALISAHYLGSISMLISFGPGRRNGNRKNIGQWVGKLYLAHTVSISDVLLSYLNIYEIVFWLMRLWSIYFEIGFHKSLHRPPQLQAFVLLFWECTFVRVPVAISSYSNICSMNVNCRFTQYFQNMPMNSRRKTAVMKGRGCSRSCQSMPGHADEKRCMFRYTPSGENKEPIG